MTENKGKKTRGKRRNPENVMVMTMRVRMKKEIGG